MWAVRCYHESQLHDRNMFITLTYDDDHVPWSSVTGEQTLVKRDLQLFWKRLRKYFAKQGVKIRYFGAGEYGDQTSRPHYHAIVFGCDMDDKQYYKHSDLGFPYFISDTLDKIWSKGQCTVADVSVDTCAYVARYVVKKQNGILGKEKYEGIEKEFSVMSRRPGIGADWFKRFKSDVYPSDDVVILDGQRARHFPTPRYYDNLLGFSDPKLLDFIKQRRIDSICQENKEDVWNVDRMKSKEAVKKAQLSFCKRSVE